MRPVAGLVLHCRVPPAVVVDDVGRLGEVEPHTACLQRQEEHGHAAGLGPGHHFLTFSGRHPTVKEEGGDLERGQVGLDQRAHLDELAEHEHRVAGTYDHLEQFVQRRQLAGPARDRPGLVQVMTSQR